MTSKPTRIETLELWAIGLVFLLTLLALWAA
jgi:hypothetical protein